MCRQPHCPGLHTRSPQRCSTLTSTYLQFLLSAFAGLRFRGPTWPIGKLQSLHIDTINLCDVADGFLSLEHPLGSLGSCLTCLTFDSIIVGDQEVPSGGSLSGDNFRAAQHWAFFRAIGRLKSLKKFALPLSIWKELTSYGLDVAAPLQELGGLVVENCEGMSACEGMHDSIFIAQVVDRRIQTS